MAQTKLFRKQTPAQQGANSRRAETKTKATEAATGVPATRAASPTEPYTIRLPKSGEIDPYFSLNRSTWRDLITGTRATGNKPLIRAKQFKLHGEKRGVWLINFADAKRVLSGGDVVPGKVVPESGTQTAEAA